MPLDVRAYPSIVKSFHRIDPIGSDPPGLLLESAADVLARLPAGTANFDIDLVDRADRQTGPLDRIVRPFHGSDPPPLIQWRWTGLLALWLGETGQIRKEAATAVNRKCRGSGSSTLRFLRGFRETEPVPTVALAPASRNGANPP